MHVKYWYLALLYRGHTTTHEKWCYAVTWRRSVCEQISVDARKCVYEENVKSERHERDRKCVWSWDGERKSFRLIDRRAGGNTHRDVRVCEVKQECVRGRDGGWGWADSSFLFLLIKLINDILTRTKNLFCFVIIRVSGFSHYLWALNIFRKNAFLCIFDVSPRTDLHELWRHKWRWCFKKHKSIMHNWTICKHTQTLVGQTDTSLSSDCCMWMWQL